MTSAAYPCTFTNFHCTLASTASSLLPLHVILKDLCTCSAEGEFKVNDSLLDKQYKNLQRQLHPDKFSTRSQVRLHLKANTRSGCRFTYIVYHLNGVLLQEERDLSDEASSLVNEAFNTLKHPLSRAEYIVRSSSSPLPVQATSC